jgi:hypothetical protein
MNRAQATALLQKYRDFPNTNIFTTKPYDYPLFHLLECFSKGWTIDRVGYQGIWTLNHAYDIDFERIGELQRNVQHELWRYVAKNPGLKNTVLGFVQKDLYCRYVGRCNPLKSPTTSWTFIPLDKVAENERFRGKIGKHTNLYLIELDLDIVDIKGEWNDNIPWHYLQQTIDWKPYKDRIEWQTNDDQDTNDPQCLIMETNR